jgi:AcrR family transcriptional regulator
MAMSDTENLEDGAATGARQHWKRDPDGVRSDILAVAMKEFAANGLAGARIDEIAARTRTSKRMIYYYFGDKDGLYRRVIEEAYREMREGEEELKLDHLPPVEALRRLVEFTFDHHCRSRDFIRLVMIENIHDAHYLEQSGLIKELNRGAISRLEELCRRGEFEGHFRHGLKPIELHWQISALCFFNVSNQATFARIFGDDLWTEQGQRSLRDVVVNTILRFALR